MDDSGVWDVGSTRRDSRTLADRVAEARHRAVVGREEEVAALRRFLEPEARERIWFLVGPGGIGKTTLLQTLRDQARRDGGACLYLDARRIDPNPLAARQALEQLCAPSDLAAFCAGHPRLVLFLDTFEVWQDLEFWLREELLPSLPLDLRVIIASRVAPSLEWCADPGWRELLSVSYLDDLPAAACQEYLAHRGIQGQDREALIRFSGGRPLVLALGADMLADGYSLDAGLEAPSLIGRLVDCFTREARCPEQRQALDASAVVRELSEHQLARMLEQDDVGDLYRWLGGLSFMARGEKGLFPHDQVRDVLMRDMPRRFPGRYERYACNAFNGIVDRIEAEESLSWDAAAGLAADGMYALRALAVVEHFMYPVGTRSLHVTAAGEGNWPILHAMTRRHEGQASAELFDHCRRRYPDQVFVVRDVHGAARGYFLKLDLEALDPEARRGDPLTERVWKAVCRNHPPKPGEHLPFVRFWCTAESGQSQSPEKTQILMAINTYNLMAGNLRLTAQIFSDSPDWKVQAPALGLLPLDGADTVIGERTWCVYVNDWQRESPTRYYRRFAERCIAFDQVVRGRAAPVQPHLEIDEVAFRRAVLDALKRLHDPSRLRHNPLLGSALVLGEAGRGADDDTRMQVLRRQFDAGARALARDAAGERRAKVLRRAYLNPARSQQHAAEALHMGYSTFRRHLAEAREALTDELWRREIACR